MKKLGDLCEIKYGERITKKNDAVDDNYTGKKYPVYGGGDITFYTKKNPNKSPGGISRMPTAVTQFWWDYSMVPGSIIISHA